MYEDVSTDRPAVLSIGAVIICAALAYLSYHHQTFVHIDAIAHVNKARGLWDSGTPGLKQLGTIWLPLQHILIAPLAWFDVLWSTGLAGSILSAACFVGTGWYLYATARTWTDSRWAGWLSFLLFALNPRLIYLFATPMTEPLMVFCAAGLVRYLVEWVDTQTWKPFALACLMVLAGTLTRYEGWAIAAIAIPVVFAATRTQRVTSTILFAGAAVTGPMLWMIYNMVYFDDPLMFVFGRGSARDYAQEYFFRNGKLFPTAGKALESLSTYWTDVAYCLNPGILWLALAGFCIAIWARRRVEWRTTSVVVVLAAGPFLFYAYNLYANMIPVMMPGLLANEPESIYNVRYGTVMAATLPVLAAFAVYFIVSQTERRRAVALALAAVMFMPDPIPEASAESPPQQLTNNLFYLEGVRNQSFWMPPFVEIANRLKDDMAKQNDGTSFVLADTRIVHPVVWATGIHMKRFVHEMNQPRWDRNLAVIDPGIRWIITEEGDLIWHAHGTTLQRDFVDVATAKLPSTGTVHLFRRR